MSVLYIKEQGAIVQKSGERIIVSKNAKTLFEMPLIQIENISIIGNVQVTTQALHMLMEHGIDISYFSYSGKYLGHVSADSSKNIFLRFEQYSFYMNDKKRLDMAKTIVENKINNQISIISSFRWEGNEYEWKRDVDQIIHYRNSLYQKQTANEVLGVEGICSNIYFSAFGHMMKGDFEFNGRNRRPPKDPVNIILSLAYTFLTREICNYLDAESFEPYLGFLHGIRYGRKSLALDVIEEFRQPIVDRLTILMFNKRMINKYDFEQNEYGEISLNEDGFKKFCTEYERWMTGKNSIAGEHFRRKIQDQVAHLKKSICKGEKYIPYSWREVNVSD